MSVATVVSIPTSKGLAKDATKMVRGMLIIIPQERKNNFSGVLGL